MKAAVTACVGLVLLLLVGPVPGTEAADILSARPLESTSREAAILQGANREISRQNEETFLAVKRLSPDGWYNVDLKPYANMNLFSGKGLTAPISFPCMPLGKQVFYGVPFSVIAPEENQNRTAVALPSTRLLTDKLLASVEVPVGRRAVALYFLHTTYYTSKEGSQSYRINYEDGSVETIRFVGTVTCGDWSAPDSRIYSDDVRCVLVPATSESRTEFRNMHVLQWENPSPDKEIKSITFSSDPKADMAIFLVAVTGHE